jgi:hypothetical protein
MNVFTMALDDPTCVDDCAESSKLKEASGGGAGGRGEGRGRGGGGAGGGQGRGGGVGRDLSRRGGCVVAVVGPGKGGEKVWPDASTGDMARDRQTH